MFKKNKKCFVSILLVLTMIFFVIPQTAFAENVSSTTDSTTNVWDGTTADTNWYTSHESNTTYTLSNAAQLAGLAQLVNGGNTFNGKTIILGADIDLGGKEWTPIGTKDKPFSGTFKGSERTISNLKIDNQNLTYAGLFGILNAPGVIKDVTIHNASINANASAGALIGSSHTGSLEDCHVTGAINISAYYKVGGLSGEGYATITDCTVDGETGSTVTGTYTEKEDNLEGDNVGGLIGYLGEGKRDAIVNCSVKNLTVSGTRKVAGIVGSIFTNNDVKNCSVTNVIVQSTATEDYITNNKSSIGIGGIVGVYTAYGSGDGSLSGCKVTNLTFNAPDGVKTGCLVGGMRGNDSMTDYPAGSWAMSSNTLSGTIPVSSGNELTMAINSAASGTTLELSNDVSVDTWNQIWDVDGLTIKGNNHTITIGQVESGSNGNYLFYGAKNLNVSDVTINFSTNGNGFSMVSGTLDNVKMIGGKSSNYAVYVSASSTGNNKVTVNKCTFDGFKDSAIYSQPAGSQKTTSDIVVNGSTFDNCGMTMCSYAPNTTFTDNTVNGGGEISFAGAVENASRDNTYTITGNTFQDAGKIWFYSADLGNVTFVKNKVLGTTSVSTEQAQDTTSLDVSENYWGGGAPGNEQLSGNNIVGNDEYYQQSSMNEEDLNTYVPPYTGKYSYEINVAKADNGSVSADKYATEGDKVTITVTPDKAYKLDELSVTTGGKDVALTDNGDGTYSFTMPSSKVQITATFVEDENYEEPTPEPSMPFTDVSENDWFYGAVQYVYDNDMMNGVSANSFAPNSNLTRTMMAAVLYNLEDQPTQADSSFTDVVDGSWYADAVNWAAANNIVSGYGDGIFGPNDNITREQMASILYRYAEYKGYDVSAVGDLGQFNDADSVSEWANDVMSWAVGAGLINGMGDGSVAPQGTATRAQVATVLMNFCENIAK